MTEKQSWFSKIKEKFSLKNKNILISVIIVIVCVVALISMSNLSTQQSNTSSTSKNNNATFDTLEYANQVSQNLTQIINNVKGVSNAKVVVVVSQSFKTEYLTETSQDGQTVVYIKNGSSYEPAIITQIQPTITGILVVAKGTNNLQVKNNLLNAISAVYNVSVSCIDILEGK